MSNAANATAVNVATLSAPGATLYYEVRGSGPTLLMIPGGPLDAGVYTDLANHLADRYTVVTYDPRGNSRSTLTEAPAEQDLDVHGDDAARLIAALDNGPAFVFGNSGGAQIGLNLTARHPERVRALVAHEPPCLMLLDDPTAAIAGDRAIHETYLREGVGPAMPQFFGVSGLDDGPEGADGPPEEFGSEEPSTEDMEAFARIEGNFEYFLAHGLLPLSLYPPDVATLRAGQPRVIVGVGEESAGEIVDQTSRALAAKLGTAPVLFPGDHVAYGPHADAFAVILHRAFGDACPEPSACRAWLTPVR